MKYIVSFILLNSITVLALGLSSKNEAKEKNDKKLLSSLAQSYKTKPSCNSKLYCKLERK